MRRGQKLGRMRPGTHRTPARFFTRQAIRVLEPGVTSLQDWPGRVGFWRTGVPPSGPFDPLAFRLANRIVGNRSGEPALEMTMLGPTLYFEESALIAWTGGTFDVTLNGLERVAPWQPHEIAAGSTLSFGSLGPLDLGFRGYLAVAGGFKAPSYLGSVASFPGQFGGFSGRGEYLAKDDVIEYEDIQYHFDRPKPRAVPHELIPAYGRHWTIGVVPGPQEAPDYLTEKDVERFYDTVWKVSKSASKLGVRLHGSCQFDWARPDGGGGGSHPSNLHDNPYGIGSINFTGDHPVILGVDGPSLGGFVCVATLPTVEQGKLGQLRPGMDAVRFTKLSLTEAVQARRNMEHFIRHLKPMEIDATFVPVSLPSIPEREAVARTIEAKDGMPKVLFRVVGDQYIMVEYGPMELDIELRVRLFQLDKWIKDQGLAGVVDRIPGVRTLLVQYNSQELSPETLLDHLEQGVLATANSKGVVPSRVVRLPLAFRERWTRESIERYTRELRSHAAYLPDNAEFIARCNGLDSVEKLRDIVFSASYMCMGLGDVYLGAPCAVAVDPRDRLTVPKYNPARTFTPEGSVGIGGSYLCVYAMDSPGGYQLFGRTLPIWNRDANLPNFKNPWLLEMFDRIQFYEVTEDELEKLREEFKGGRYQVEIEDGKFNVEEHKEFCASIAPEVEAHEERKRKGAELMRQLDAELMKKHPPTSVSDDAGDEAIVFADPQSDTELGSPLPGTVVKVVAKSGEQIAQGDVILVLNSMKMEVPVLAPRAGKLDLKQALGKTVEVDQLLAKIE